MAFVTPTNVTVGSVLEASKYNQEVVANAAAIRAAQINVQQDLDSTKQTITSLAANTYSSDVLSIAITPSATSSKVLVTCQLAVSCEGSTPVAASLFKGGSILSAATGDAAASRSRISAAVLTNTENPTTLSFAYLDSPNVVTATTYSVRLRHGSLTEKTLTVNSSFSDTDNQVFWRTISTLTVQEIPV